MLIVTAGIIQKNGQVLIARRNPGQFMAGRWEFPGGKLEPGETPQQGLHRELAEELGIDATIGQFIGTSQFDYKEKQIQLQAYQINDFTGKIVLVDHSEYLWVDPRDLNKYELTPADLPLVPKIIATISPN